MTLHTLEIFRSILANLPPLFPAETERKMKNALEQLENNANLSPKMVEDTMVRFGYDLWPYNEAYREFYTVNEGRLCEQFLLSHLSKELGGEVAKIEPFSLAWRDLYSGKAVSKFSSEERNELSRALIATKNDLVRFTDRELISLSKQKYLDKVEEFKSILAHIKEIFSSLRLMADDVQYHPILANEIREKVRWFEMSLCTLAPNLNLDEVYSSLEFFSERKTYLNMLRGIDKPAVVNFYS